jgi:hypothetical protein
MIKSKKKKRGDEGLKGILSHELEPYLKRDDVQKYLRKIQSDAHKKEVWEGLSSYTKLKLLRYVAEKKGDERGKRN